ncbi:hypothetical protein B0J11DRAFT_587661 [Dendryphion nanum]|uniref:Zn(2)-C6 fungal-type domain-containing protein n=1 Tax=Dendryphion nanum TaxID=256645 RepID=A0A9P9EF82_9PLEO|nr:hypothetical protein B0J11DRAFT_587661 [Dendryphion nanum]
MPTRSKNERTRAGCWTCRARRKKCDETRPHCKNCSNLLLRCEGYDVRVKWASQTTPSVIHDQTFQGKSEPSSKIRGNGRMVEPFLTRPHAAIGSPRRDILFEYLGRDYLDSLTAKDREILQDFFEWGVMTIISNIWTTPEKYLEVFAESKTLQAVCLTYQVTIDPRHAALVDQYYQRGIEQFRRELLKPARIENEGTIYAGLLLGSISMNRNMPWSIHLNGLASILEERGVFAHLDGGAKDFIYLLGVTDLPSHAFGRKTKHLHLWAKHCRSKSGIEQVTGLPCSLVDLLCLVMEPGIEEQLLQWQLESGTQEQQKIWDASRYAGVIMAENHCLSHSGIKQVFAESPDLQSPKLAFAVRQIINTLYELRAQVTKDFPRLSQALLFPLGAAGSQPWALSAADKALVNDCLSNLAVNELPLHPYYNVVSRALQELWENGNGRTINQVVKDLDIELALF